MASSALEQADYRWFISPVEVASPSFKPDIREIADVGGVRVVAIAEHGHIEQVCRRRILPDLGIDAGEVDLLVEPAADRVVTAVGNEVGLRLCGGLCRRWSRAVERFF